MCVPQVSPSSNHVGAKLGHTVRTHLEADWIQFWYKIGSKLDHVGEGGTAKVEPNLGQVEVEMSNFGNNLDS